MGLSFTVGGAKGTFEERFAVEVAGVLDNAFGAEGDWEGVAPRHFGELVDAGWAELQDRAAAELGEDSVPNLLALGAEGRGRLPARPRPGGLAAALGRRPAPLRQPAAASAPSWPSWPNAGSCRSTTRGCRTSSR